MHNYEVHQHTLFCERCNQPFKTPHVNVHLCPPCYFPNQIVPIIRRINAGRRSA